MLKVKSSCALLVALMLILHADVSTKAYAKETGQVALPPAPTENPSGIEDPMSCKTDKWGGKFYFGAYSTLVSSYLMGIEFPDLIELSNDPSRNAEQLERRIYQFQIRYLTFTCDELYNLIDEFNAHGGTNSIFDMDRSNLTTPYLASLFKNNMDDRFKPVDEILTPEGFKSTNFQFNTHRGLYNNSFGIPQNSLAAIINAYVAGIRSVEMDVLETQEHAVVVIHDLVTNRLDGNFVNAPEYVGLYNSAQITTVPMDILNPLGNEPEVAGTGLTISRADAILDFISDYLCEMTVYLDARNDTPVSMLKLLDEHPEYRDFTVIKMYPFSLSGGVSDLVRVYHDRYMQTSSIEATRKHIANLRGNFLFVLGAANGEYNPEVFVEGLIDFGWNKFQEETKYLPFSRKNQTLNHFEGEQVFSNDELAKIESLSYQMFNWSMGLTGITRARVLQLAVMPSLEHIITHNDEDEFHEMPQKAKITSAASDNFLRLVDRVLSDELQLKVKTYYNMKNSNSTEGKSGKNDKTTEPPIKEDLRRTAGNDCNVPSEANLKDCLKGVVLGFSDRYPDYSFAKRDGEGNVLQETLRDFYYKMTGVVYSQEGYVAEKKRSTQAALEKMRERENKTLKYQYATTDLPTDLRLAFSGNLVDKDGVPIDFRYRASGLIKQKYTPVNIEAYSPPQWTEQLYWRWRRTDVEAFDEGYKKWMDAFQQGSKNRKLLYNMFIVSNVEGTLVIDFETLEKLGYTDPVTADQILADNRDPEFRDLLLTYNKRAEEGEFMASRYKSELREKFRVGSEWAWPDPPTN